MSTSPSRQRSGAAAAHRAGRVAAATVAAVAAVALHGLAGPAAHAAVPPVGWCGETAAIDRPDETRTHLVHTVYALPSDAPDRFRAVASAITTDLDAVDAWWLAQDPTRRPRFDFHPFAGCPSRWGMLDISFVRLPQSTSHYQGEGAPSGVANRVRSDLAAALGDVPWKKYLVYYDGTVSIGRVCGLSPVAPEAAGVNRAAFVFTRPLDEGGVPASCGTLGQQGWTAITAAHELLHNLGAVPNEAPHRCPDSGHTCDDARDVMYAGGERASSILTNRVLDLGRDDYYGHVSSWWDVQDSLWLQQVGTPQATLRATVSGPGRVTSAPAGLDCRADCDFLFNANARVTLSARPDAGTRLRAWGGACTGSAATCTLTLASAQHLTAQFAPPNQRPSAAFKLPATHPIAAPIVVASTSQDPDGAIVSHAWSFGDGSTATGTTARHAYASPGAYRIRLTVTDDEGAAASQERTVLVLDSPPRATAYARTARRGAPVRLALRVEDDVRVDRARIVVLAGSRPVASFVRAIDARSAASHVTWHAPKTAGSYRSCVEAWDSRGQASGRSCAPLRVR